MTTVSDRFRPVVALDVDGVIRIPEPRRGEVDAIRVEVTMSRDAYPRLFHRAPRWDSDGTLTGTHFFSAKGVEWVRSLVARGVDVRWCTSWQHYANTYFAPRLGLPALPVITGDPLPRHDTSVDWKVRNIAAATRGRPVLWVDDHPWDDGLRYSHTPRALTEVRGIDPTTGITTRDVHAMDAWLTLASTSEGHDELYRRWRRELARRRRNRPPQDPPAEPPPYSIRPGDAAETSSPDHAGVDAHEAAELLGLDTSTLQQLVSSGELRAASDIGEPLMLRRGDITAYRSLLYMRRNDFIAESSAQYEEVDPDEAARVASEVRKLPLGGRPRGSDS